MTHALKNPLEIAIAAVEACTRHGGLTDYNGYLGKMAQLRGGRPAQVDERAYLDHALRILIEAGYMRRHHMGPGRLLYGPTSSWKHRDTLLAPLRYRKPVVRAWRIRLAEQRKAEKQEQRRLAKEQASIEREEARRLRKEAKRLELIAERGLTPSGKIRRKSRADSMAARGELVRQPMQGGVA